MLPNFFAVDADNSEQDSDGSIPFEKTDFFEKQLVKMEANQYFIKTSAKNSTY